MSNTNNQSGFSLLILTIIITALFLIGGTTYYFVRQSTEKFNDSMTMKIEESKTATSSSKLTSQNTETKTFIINGLELKLPKQWELIYANPQTYGFTDIYVATKPEEVQQLADCATAGKCGTPPLKIEPLGNTALPNNKTFEAFVQETTPGLDLNKLEKTTIDKRDAWTGYVGPNNLSYYAVSKIGEESTGQATWVIKVTAQNKELLETFVQAVPKSKLYQQTNAYASRVDKKEDINPKRGFKIEVSSKLKTDGWDFLMFMIGNVFEQNSEKKNYYYSVHLDMKDKENPLMSQNLNADFLNSTYYLLTNNEELKDGTMSSPQVTIKLTQIQNLGNYLANPKYCQVDNDCMFRSNFCDTTAYNAYHEFFTPWGCGMGSYPDIGDQAMEAFYKSCTANQYVDVKVDSVKCESNVCTSVNPVPYCKNMQ